jgi:hypothetical protein
MFVNYRVTADYVEPRTSWVVGVGAECVTLAEALEVAESYRNNPKLTNVETRTVRYGVG